VFVDQVRLRLVAGKGGNGVVAWRREKYIPKGGPAGGNGGKGGSIILRATSRMRSLELYRHRRLLRAENGRAGGASRCKGRTGRDLVVELPCGTLIKDVESEQVLCDLTEAGQEWRICSGGRGGRGNASFRSPTHRAPALCTPGKEGEERWVELELKLIADVGLVGFPNAGKSTLLQALTHRPVKIAPYPFTTLFPNLGLLSLHSGQQLVVADIPGIIEGASEDRGLGLDFLRHIERTQVLIFVLDGSGIDGRRAADDYQVLRQELSAYDPALCDRPFVVAMNKCDTEEYREQVREFRCRHPLPADQLFEISAREKVGLLPLVEQLEHLRYRPAHGQDHQVGHAGEQGNGGADGPVEIIAEPCTGPGKEDSQHDC
jgi:GTPase